ncbi:hypothetical protein MRY87_05730 [bacterium]|nr:hypothetical protein [bacterium]
MTSTSSLIISLFLFSLGGWVALWILLSILRPLLSTFFPGGARKWKGGGSRSGASERPPFSFARFSERSIFRRSARALKDLERLLSDNSMKRAKKLFPKAVYLEWVQHSPELLAKGAHHNVEVLNKLIIYAELQDRSVRNLPKLESLFSKLHELVQESFETRLARQRFLTKQKQKGNSVPSWSTKEFDTRLSDLKNKWEHEKDILLSELHEALQLRTGRSSQDRNEPQYH